MYKFNSSKRDFLTLKEYKNFANKMYVIHQSINTRLITTKILAKKRHIPN